MSFEIIDTALKVDSRFQRWSHLLAISFCFFGILIGINIRNSNLNATTTYINNEAGIRANYPAEWLLDVDGSYVFRVQDISRPGFKTSIQIEIFPFTEEMSPANVIEDLSLSRARVLSTYDILGVRDYLLDDVPATLSEYTYVFTQANPFTQSVPIVVIGQDILVQRRGQAILISFLTDADSYGEDIAIFEAFLESLEF